MHHRLLLALVPAVAILAVVLADVFVGRSVVLGLLVVGPLLASNLVGPRLTAGYGALAFGTAVLLGVRNDAYLAGDRLNAQLIRLSMIAVMSVVGVLLSRFRLQREERLSRVTKVAEAAQRAILLPVPGQVGPARVAVHYESAARDSLVGGDMYGVALTPYGLRILVGDVRGKGLEAVRISAQVLAAFRERAEDGADLAELMDRLHRAVTRCADSEEDFVTAVLVQVDDEGQVTVVNAGHPYPIILANGQSAPLRPHTHAPPLGLDGAPQPTTFRLGPGDRLLLYTDGLVEARDSEHEFFPARLIDAALATDGDVTQALSALRDAVLRWSGGALHDDLALVLIQYAPGLARPGTTREADVSPDLAPVDEQVSTVRR